MFKNKKLLFAASLVTLGVIISGCSSNTAAPTVTVTAEPPAPELSAEDLYINNLRSQGNFYVTVNTDTDLINLGYTLCGELDSGYTVLDVIESLVMSGDFNGDPDAVEFAGLVIGAAVRDLCPEYSYQIEALS
jgi:hypothetical protein